MNTFIIIIFISFSRVYEFFLKQSFSLISSFKKIKQQKNKLKKLLSIYLIIDLYFEKTKNFRVNYVKIRKILQMIKKSFYNNDDLLRNLLFKLNSLKRYVQQHILLFKLLRKILKIVIEKQSFLNEQKKIKINNVLNA